MLLSGSELSFIWKNIIQNETVHIKNNYFNNLNNTLQLDQINTITIKALYYMDYLSIQHLTKQRKE